MEDHMLELQRKILEDMIDHPSYIQLRAAMINHMSSYWSNIVWNR